MVREIPEFLRKRIVQDYGNDLEREILSGLMQEKKVTLRVNNLKSNIDFVKNSLKLADITYKECKWYDNALIIENANEEKIRKLESYQKGEIYMQSLSSMLPPLILEPKKDENILDMTSAPGGKTTQIASISRNNAMITACEKNKIRFEKIKYNIEKQGARVNLLQTDARELDEYFSFDKILLDSPCSGSGTENVFSEKFTDELLKRTVKLQEKLLEKAMKIVKIGGEVIYSTCSILKIENEEIIDKIVKKFEAEVIEIEEPERNRVFTCEFEAVLFVLNQIVNMRAFLFQRLNV